MDTINFSDAFLTPEVHELVDAEVYGRTEVIKVGAPLRLIGTNETADDAYKKIGTVLDSLEPKLKGELAGLVGYSSEQKKLLPSELDSSGLQYGLSVLAATNAYTPVDIEAGKDQQTVVHVALAQLSPEALERLVALSENYHTQEAYASIGLVAGDKTINGGPSRGQMTTYDFIRERGAHFDASRISNRGGAMALQAYEAAQGAKASS